MSRSSAAVVLALAMALMLPATSSAKGAQLVTKSAKQANAHLSACIAPAIICAGGKAAEAVGGAVGDVVSSAADSAMGGVVEWAANGAAWLVEGVAKQIEQSTRPELADPWFASRYDAMIMLAAPFAGLFLLLAVGQAILAQDMARLVRAVCLLLPCALFVTFVAVTLTELALRVTDEMTAWVLQGTGDEMKGAFAALGKVFAGTGS